MKRVIKLNENTIKRIVAESVRRIIMEGGWQTVTNDDGEPLGTEYIPDAYEQEIDDYDPEGYDWDEYNDEDYERGNNDLDPFFRY